ncbi:hypothetical protein DPMN_136218 [Dreissena polymorpha]|uniref:Uncharacterized protein n=1 Tax=Dreissena polymorpha TaxID=45954 RepID=A0A9D4G0H0_DREPO|nr:hypothetical protein DPMN_136218 [Dreissena polymorpha]
MKLDNFKPEKQNHSYSATPSPSKKQHQREGMKREYAASKQVGMGQLTSASLCRLLNSDLAQIHLVFVSRVISASRKKALANSEDPDETPHDAASYQGLRYLLK